MVGVVAAWARSNGFGKVQRQPQFASTASVEEFYEDYTKVCLMVYSRVLYTIPSRFSGSSDEM
jgi:hypothetical protein